MMLLIQCEPVFKRLTKEASLSSGQRRHKGHRQRSPYRDAVSVVLSVVLTMVLLGTAALVITRFGVASNSGILSASDKEYYDYALSNVSTKTREYAESTGVDASVLDDVFTMEQIKSDTEGFVSAELNGDAYEPDTTAARNAITVNMLNASVAGDASSSFVDGVLNVYVSAVRLDNLDTIVQKRNSFLQVFPVALAALVVIGAVCVVALLKLHHFPHRSLRFVMYATGAAAVISFLVPSVLLATGYHERLNLSPQQYELFVSAIVLHSLKLCLVGSALFVVVTAVLALVIRQLRADAVKRRNMH